MKKIIIVLAIMFSASSLAHAQKWTLGTNAIQWADLATINLETSYAVAQHFTLNAGGRYNYWYFKRGTDNQFQNRKRGLWFGTRYWPWYTNSGWFIQMKGQWQEYNHFLPNITDVKEEGDGFGVGLGFGFAKMVNEHFNIEFGLGAWGGLAIYNEDLRPENGKRITEGATKTFILPDDLCINFVYVF